jgi:hypothetical protein
MMLVKSYVGQTAIGILTSLSLFLVYQPAMANEFSDMFRSFLSNQTFGRTSDPIVQREQNLSNRIIEAINSNKITPDQSQSLKAQYDHIRDVERGYRTTNPQLDAIGAATVNNLLGQLETSLDQMLAANATKSGAMLDDTDAHFNEALRKITQSLASGRLTINEATSLKDDYNHVLAERNRLRAGGALSADGISRVSEALRQLDRKIKESSHDSQQWPGIDGQQAVQAQRLADGLATGKISRQEYNEMKAQADRIAAEESRARANGLQLDETLALATGLDGLRTKIDASLNRTVVNTGGPGGAWPGPGGPRGPGGSAGPGGSGAGDWGGHGSPGGWARAGHGWSGWGGGNFNSRQAELRRRMQDGETSGKLTADDAAELKYDMGRLEQLEQSYRSLHNTLTPEDLSVLNEGLNRINIELNEKLSDVPNTYPEIDKRQADLKRRVDEGVSQGLLKPFEGAKFRADLDWIASVEATLRQSGGSLDGGEAARLNQDLDRYSQRLDKAMSKAGPMQDIAARKSTLAKKIDDAAAGGRLSVLVSRMLRDQLQHLDWFQNRLASDGRLDPQDQKQVLTELDRINASLNQSMADQAQRLIQPSRRR